MWDAETSLSLGAGVGANRTGANIEVAEPYNYLRSSEEFRLRFADRAHRALFDNGPFTPTQAIARYEQILSEVDRAIVAESARWGDQHRSTPYTREDWLREADHVINNFLEPRTDIFIDQLRSAGIYPSVDAVVYNRHGGQVADGFQLTMTTTSGAIYFTTDGSDPRGANGQPAGTFYQSPFLLTDAITVNARTLRNGQWSALNEATFELTELVLGDTNFDGRVDSRDLNNIAIHWQQQSEATWEDGDFNGDGKVNSSDLNDIAVNWQFGVEVVDRAAARVPRAALASPITRSAKACITQTSVPPARGVDQAVAEEFGESFNFSRRWKGDAIARRTRDA
jgi:hypothetical protein